MELALLGKIN